MNESGENQDGFDIAFRGGGSAEALFDEIADTVYFEKDRLGRYLAVSQTLVERCGLSRKDKLIGRHPRDVFPAALSTPIAAQDREVLETGAVIRAKLELHLYPGGREGWCLTWKVPVRGRDGGIVGLSGISRDLREYRDEDENTGNIAKVLRFIEDHVAEQLRATELAALAGLSRFQLAARVRGLFGLTLGQYITRARINAARDRLASTDRAIAEIALECGYGDQAAFSRQFRRSVGLSPGQNRENAK